MSFKFRVALLVALSALVMSACASSGSADESGVPVEPVETAGVDTSAVCPDAENAAPERLPVGEVIELHDNGADHVVCASYNRTPRPAEHISRRGRTAASTANRFRTRRLSIPLNTERSGLRTERT